MQITISIIIVVVFLLVSFYISQSRFKNKMLCTFIRPNLQKIEKWVPLDSNHVIFDRGKQGKGRYICDPKCITHIWFTRGINKFFPTLVPTLDFKWDTPNPINPRTFESTWQTPEVLDASWEGRQHELFSKGTAAQAGKKGRFPEWLFPVATILLVLVVLFVTYQGINGLDERLFYLEQAVKIR